MRSAFGALAALLALGLTALAPAQQGPRPAVPAGLTVWLTGDPNDVVVDQSAGPGLLLMGGGSEVTAAFRDRAFPLIGGGDIVVLRTSGSDGYNNYFFNQIDNGALKPNSVETLLLNSRALADSEYVEWVLATAEMIWMAGGDQSTYTSNWRGTRTETQLRTAIARGAVVGGTSAGMAVGGEFIYDPGSASSLTTAMAAANPYNSSMRITDHLFQFPFLEMTISDTHFRERDRMGRLMGMMGYLRQEGRATDAIRGIAASEQSSIYINKDGVGIVDTNSGRDGVYILLEQPTTERVQVAPNQPLIYNNLLRYKLRQGETFDFRTNTTSKPAMNLSIDGRNPGAVYTPTDPYSDDVVPPPPPPTGQVYYEPFEGNPTALADRGHLVINLEGGTRAWESFNLGGTPGRVARLRPNAASPKDDWLITPFFELTAGREYALSFWYQGTGAVGTSEALDIYLGTTRSVAGMTGNTGSKLLELAGFNASNTPATRTVFFTPETTGNHALAFHGRSPANQESIYLDEIRVQRSDVPPPAVELEYPVDGASDVFRVTYLQFPPNPVVREYDLRLATFAPDLDQPASIIATLTDQYYVDPGPLVPGETYYVRVDSRGTGGTTEGPVTVFSVLREPAVAGDLFLRENFDRTFAVGGLPAGFPPLMNGWEALDGDGAINADGFAAAWYPAPSNFARSAPQALVTRYNPDATPNNDWIFFPIVTAPAGGRTLVEFHGRARINTFTETVEAQAVLLADGEAAIEDYQLLGTITTNSTTMTRHEFELPAGGDVRFALRYASNFQSQYVVDDVRLWLDAAPMGNTHAWMIY